MAIVPAPVAMAAGRRILVVDDDRAVALGLVELLEPAGYTVHATADGTQALDLAVSTRPDLVVLDVNLPPTDGFDTAARMRQSPSACDIPILFLSGVRDLAIRMRSLRIADVDFLRKPFEVNELLARIERVLEMAQARQALHRQAELDELTGLGNLRVFQARLASEHARFLRYGDPLSLVVIDVDKLKRINDQHGHLAGNVALRQVAEVIQREAREVDLPVRYGGDEFLVILPHTTLPEAAVFAHRVREAVGRVGTIERPLSVSIGVASLSLAGSTDTTEQLLERADAAAYRSKRAGGNCISLDDESVR
jgi:two-component system cell cycle response regulator